MSFDIGLFRKFSKVGEGGGVKYVFLSLWQQLLCLAEGKTLQGLLHRQTADLCSTHFLTEGLAYEEYKMFGLISGV
jgi:hypothetical protein